MCPLLLPFSWFYIMFSCFFLVFSLVWERGLLASACVRVVCACACPKSSGDPSLHAPYPTAARARRQINLHKTTTTHQYPNHPPTHPNPHAAPTHTNKKPPFPPKWLLLLLLVASR